MVYESNISATVPDLDLLSFIFESSYNYAEDDTILYSDAADSSRSLSKLQSCKIVKQLAYILRMKFHIGENGPGKDVVMAFQSGHIFSPIMFYSVIAAGGVFAAGNLTWSIEDISRTMEETSSQLMICSGDNQGLAKRAATACNLPLSNVLVFDYCGQDVNNGLHFSSLDEETTYHLKEELPFDRVEDQKELEARVALLVYTSGSTGKPKGVMLSHRNLVASPFLIDKVQEPYQKELQAQGKPRYRGSIIACYPLSFLGSINCFYVFCAFSGGTVYWMPKPEIGELLQYQQRYRTELFFAPPRLWVAISRMAGPDIKSALSSLSCVQFGGAALSADTQRAISLALPPGVYLESVWGMTETNAPVTYPVLGSPNMTGSMSPPLPCVLLRLGDDNYEDVQPGTPGEILVKSPTVFPGYYKNADLTAQAFTRDGWFKTGDVAVDREGKIFFLDRKKDLLKYEQHHIVGAILEGVILSHPMVKDAAIVGIHQDGDDLPAAFVVADGKLTVEGVHQHVNARVNHWEQLRGGVKFVDDIPRNAFGKVLKNELQAKTSSERTR